MRGLALASTRPFLYCCLIYLLWLQGAHAGISIISRLRLDSFEFNSEQVWSIVCMFALDASYAYELLDRWSIAPVTHHLHPQS